ncbi:MAG: FIST C-terminal domain-containing protein [Prochloraceae cyanobacterium]|nr:FIST C-terminal domain-containing protein [Prochloraceae cyanobacterium]
MANQIQWTNALSIRPSLEAAVKEVVDRVKQSLSENPDLGIVFISSAYASEYSRLVPLILEQISIPVLIGCGGEGIVGIDDRNEVLEIESQPALSLSAAKLPEVEIDIFHVKNEDLPDLDSSPEAWVELVGVSVESSPQFILLSDPFSSKINDLLEGLDFAYPGSAKVGGLASSSSMVGQTALFFHGEGDRGDYLRSQGTIGIALSGNIVLDTIVAQGCRPISNPYQITKAERNIILALAESGDRENCSRPPLEILQQIISTLDEKDRKLVENSLFVGIARDEFKVELGQRDFLIRNLLGIDPKSGAIAIGDRIRPGQRIQFHLRDAETSAEDLDLLLKSYQQEQTLVASPAGALIFSCLGRGQRLYGKPNFDSKLFSSYLGNTPLGGFFCNGEIGPVGSRTFLHGYTSAFAIVKQL